MKVQRAIIPNNNIITWLVLGDDLLPIAPIQQFLTYLGNIERSPNTIRAYAYHLKIFWTYLSSNEMEWINIGLNEMASFIHWLRDPQPRNIIAIHQRMAKRTESTINIILTAVAMFYDYYERLGIVPINPLYKQSPSTCRKYKRFLHGITKAKPTRINHLKLKARNPTFQIITNEQANMLMDACYRLRDKFLISLLYETGMRIGQALGLRHEDIHSRECIIYIVARTNNANEIRSKTKKSYPIHVSANLIKLYANYLVDEVQDISSDYVFVNLWRKPIGKAMTISAVEDLFRRLSHKTGIVVHPHMLRHTHATELICSGWDVAYVQHRLGHASIQTTINTYVHIPESELKKQFEQYQLNKEKL